MNQKRSTCLSVGVLLSALICPAGEASVSEKVGFTITIHIYNYAAVSEKTVARAKGEAERIFRCAGLTALWVDHLVEDAGDQGRPGASNCALGRHPFRSKVAHTVTGRVSQVCDGRGFILADCQCFYESGNRTPDGWRAFSRSGIGSCHSS